MDVGNLFKPYKYELHVETNSQFVKPSIETGSGPKIKLRLATHLTNLMGLDRRPIQSHYIILYIPQLNT